MNDFLQFIGYHWNLDEVLHDIARYALHIHPEFRRVEVRREGDQVFIRGFLTLQGELAYMRERMDGKL